MEIKKNLFNNIGKDKMLLMAIAGIVLILCSYMDFTKSDTDEKSENSNTTVSMGDNNSIDYIAKLEEKLAKLIQNVNGAGECQVMITVKGTSEKILQVDSSTSNKSETGNNSVNESDTSKTTLILQGEDEEYPYVIKELMPEVEGVVVVAQGAANKKINADIIKIVQALFNVETHKISIIEMK